MGPGFGERQHCNRAVPCADSAVGHQPARVDAQRPMPEVSGQQVFQRTGNHLGGAAQVLQIEPLIGAFGV